MTFTFNCFQTEISIPRSYATCTNQPGTYSCACRVGFGGTPPNCADIDECVTGKVRKSFVFIYI